MKPTDQPEIKIDSASVFHAESARMAATYLKGKKLTAEFAEEQKKLKNRFQPRIAKAMDLVKRIAAALEQFACDRWEELGLTETGKKSADNLTGTVNFGFRKGKPAVVARAEWDGEAWDEAAAAAMIKQAIDNGSEADAERLAPLLKIPPPELNKSACLALSTAGIIDLDEFGLEISQDDKFFVKVKE